MTGHLAGSALENGTIDLRVISLSPTLGMECTSLKTKKEILKKEGRREKRPNHITTPNCKVTWEIQPLFPMSSSSHYQ